MSSHTDVQGQNKSVVFLRLCFSVMFDICLIYVVVYVYNQSNTTTCYFAHYTEQDDHQHEITNGKIAIDDLKFVLLTLVIYMHWQKWRA